MLREEDVPALAHLLFGAFVQGALRIAASAEPEQTSLEVRQAIRLLTEGLMKRNRL
jgi:hypothetical protein